MSAYYNEIDPYAAQWLRNLIKAGLIAPGYVDETSGTELRLTLFNEGSDIAKQLKVGKPVRVQWMRHEETAWDTKGPPYAFKLRGGLDARGSLVALDYDARALDYNHLWYNEADTVLISQLMGKRPEKIAPGNAEKPVVQYAIAHQRLTASIVGLPMIWETPLRTGNLRDPNGPQSTFASESFIDEMAALAKADPLDFRVGMIERSAEDSGFRKARSLAVLKAAAEKYGWERRPAGGRRNRSMPSLSMKNTSSNPIGKAIR